MRLILMGTGPFAVPAFRALLNGPHIVLGLVTRPDRPARGKTAAETNPARALAMQRGLTVIAPESVNSPEAHDQLRAWGADLFVVCDYGQILSRETLGLARLGGINLHGSLLPDYRGAAPIQWAIYHGETETGVTVIHMTPLLDGGPCLVQRSTPIGPDETNVELEPRLAELGVQATLGALALLESGQTTGIAQDAALASRAPRLQKNAGRLDWTRSAEELRNQIRAWQPWPKSFTHWLRPEGEPLRLIIDGAAVHGEVATISLLHRSGLSNETLPGTVISAYDEELIVRCGRGSLQLTAIQPAGKKTLTAGEFLRGQRVKIGERFGEK